MQQPPRPVSPAAARLVAIVVAVALWGAVFAIAYVAARGMR